MVALNKYFQIWQLPFHICWLQECPLALQPFSFLCAQHSQRKKFGCSSRPYPSQGSWTEEFFHLNFHQRIANASVWKKPQTDKKTPKIRQTNHNPPSHKNNVKASKEITYINSYLLLIFACASIGFFLLEVQTLQVHRAILFPSAPVMNGSQMCLELFYLQAHRVRPCCSRGNERFGNSSPWGSWSTPCWGAREDLKLKKTPKTMCNFDSLPFVTKTLQ